MVGFLKLMSPSDSMRTVELSDNTEYFSKGFQVISESLDNSTVVTLVYWDKNNDEQTVLVSTGCFYPVIAKRFMATGSNANIKVNIFEWGKIRCLLEILIV